MERKVDEPGPSLVTIDSPSFCISAETLDKSQRSASIEAKEVAMIAISKIYNFVQRFGRCIWKHVESVDIKTAP